MAPEIKPHYPNGSYGAASPDAITKHSILGFLKEHSWAIIAALIAGGWILTPATKSSVDELAKKFDQYIEKREKSDDKFDTRFGRVESFVTDSRIWQARIEEKLNAGAPPSLPMSPPQIQNQPARTQGRVRPKKCSGLFSFCR